MSKISDIFHLWSTMWWCCWMKAETSFSHVYGSRYCHVYSPGEHGFYLWWVSWHSELHRFKYKKQKSPPIPNWKEKGEQDKRRGEVICHPYRMFEVVFLHPPPPPVCPLSLGEMQKSALWGEAASSLQLHLGGLCECQWGLIMVSSLRFFSTTKSVCMSVCTGSCSDYEANWLTGDTWIY